MPSYPPTTPRSTPVEGPATADPDADDRRLLPPSLVGGSALVAAVVVVALAALGPLGWGTILYPTSSSAVWQTQAQDLVDVVLIAPLLLLGGVLELRRRPSAKYLLVLPALSLFYTGLAYGVGQEWGNPQYSGNSYEFAPMFLSLIVAALLLTIGSLSQFRRSDAPTLAARPLRIYTWVGVPFLLMFALLWILQVVQVMTTGNTADGSYAASPTAFWLVRYLDLGVTIPLGLVTFTVLLPRVQRAYGLALLFVGYFVTLGTAVCAMGALLAYHNDPAVSGGNSVQLLIFGALAAMAYGLLYYLVRPKFGRWRELARAITGRGPTGRAA